VREAEEDFIQRLDIVTWYSSEKHLTARSCFPIPVTCTYKKAAGRVYLRLFLFDG
jgi:hypothetical protein